MFLLHTIIFVILILEDAVIADDEIYCHLLSAFGMAACRLARYFHKHGFIKFSWLWSLLFKNEKGWAWKVWDTAMA